jgi:GNAT superfamily N-acetyltransferase
MELTLRRHGPNDPELPDILSLIQSSFEYMGGIVNPPSSVHLLTQSRFNELAQNSEVWSLSPPMSACVIFNPKADAFYIGKLSVALSARGNGLARRLIDHAETRARCHGKKWLELQVRVELTANHAAFIAMGFHEVGRTRHEGFSAPTSITFRRYVD